MIVLARARLQLVINRKSCKTAVKENYEMMKPQCNQPSIS